MILAIERHSEHMDKVREQSEGSKQERVTIGREKTLDTT
jgi:hypothetical protein